jgi:hypothetical protein
VGVGEADPIALTERHRCLRLPQRTGARARTASAAPLCLVVTSTDPFRPTHRMAPDRSPRTPASVCGRKPVEWLPRGQIERAERVPQPADVGVGRAPPRRLP